MNVNIVVIEVFFSRYKYRTNFWSLWNPWQRVSPFWFALPACIEFLSLKARVTSFKSQQHYWVSVSTQFDQNKQSIFFSSKDNPSLYSRWSYYGDVTQKLSVTFSFFAWNVLHIGWMGRTELHVVLVIFLIECWTLFNERDKVGSYLSSSHEVIGMDSSSPDVKSVIK